MRKNCWLISEEKDKQKKKQAQLKSQFEKTLHDQAEKSLRQQLFNEQIKVQGVQSRQAQGVVDKYKALILQVISANWIIPTQANKKRYSELMIRLAPGGIVLDVQITRSSGDPLDRPCARNCLNLHHCLCRLIPVSLNPSGNLY